jgi:hypothetical protein
MAQGDKSTMLRVVLIVFAVISFVYGVVFLFVPGVWVNLAGGDLVDYGWLRWPGGFLIALGIGAVMIARKPENQGPFVFCLALADLLGGLGTLYSLIMQEYTGSMRFILIPTALMLLVSGFLWWGLGRAKDSL